MKSAAVVVALVALVVAVAAGFPSSAAAQELRASTGRQLLALEPSQVFLIACLTIGGFVLIVALLACIVVANRYGGVVEEETRQEKMAQQGNYSTAVVYTDTQATPAQVRKTHSATKTNHTRKFHSLSALCTSLRCSRITQHRASPDRQSRHPTRHR